MPRGKPKKIYSDEIKETARARYELGESLSKIARDLGVAKSTLSGWLNGNGSSEINQKHLEARENRKLQFINKAWDVIDQALTLSSQKIRLATVSTERFEPLLNELISLLKENDGVTAEQVRDIIKSVSRVMDIGLTEISTFAGTIYDKQSKASGEEDAKFVFEIRGEGDYQVVAKALEGLSDNAKQEVVDAIRRVRNEANGVQH